MKITRENAKELLPFVKALAEGKMIQDKIEGLTGWVDTDEINLEFEGQKILHRIKPEPRYRSFKSQEECFDEMLKHQPFGWFRSTYNKNLYNIICIDENGIKFNNMVSKRNETYDRAFSVLEFADGTPFGVKE